MTPESVHGASKKQFLSDIVQHVTNTMQFIVLCVHVSLYQQCFFTNFINNKTARVNKRLQIFTAERHIHEKYTSVKKTL